LNLNKIGNELGTNHPSDACNSFLKYWPKEKNGISRLRAAVLVLNGKFCDQ
jgi:hypothetical protein